MSSASNHDMLALPAYGAPHATTDQSLTAYQRALMQVAREVNRYDAQDIDKMLGDMRHAAVHTVSADALRRCDSQRTAMLKRQITSLVFRKGVGVDDVAMLAGILVGAALCGGFGLGGESGLARRKDRARNVDLMLDRMHDRVTHGELFYGGSLGCMLPQTTCETINDWFTTTMEPGLRTFVHKRAEEVIPVSAETIGNYAVAAQLNLLDDLLDDSFTPEQFRERVRQYDHQLEQLGEVNRLSGGRSQIAALQSAQMTRMMDVHGDIRLDGMQLRNFGQKSMSVETMQQIMQIVHAGSFVDADTQETVRDSERIVARIRDLMIEAEQVDGHTTAAYQDMPEYEVVDDMADDRDDVQADVIPAEGVVVTEVIDTLPTADHTHELLSDTTVHDDDVRSDEPEAKTEDASDEDDSLMSYIRANTPNGSAYMSDEAREQLYEQVKQPHTMYINIGNKQCEFTVIDTDEVAALTSQTVLYDEPSFGLTEDDYLRLAQSGYLIEKGFDKAAYDKLVTPAANSHMTYVYNATQHTDYIGFTDLPRLSFEGVVVNDTTVVDAYDPERIDGMAWASDRSMISDMAHLKLKLALQARDIDWHRHTTIDDYVQAYGEDSLNDSARTYLNEARGVYTIDSNQGSFDI